MHKQKQIKLKSGLEDLHATWNGPILQLPEPA